MTHAVHVSTESKQDYVTPMDFIQIVEKQFGCNLILDLATDGTNCRCPAGIMVGEDSLSKDWFLEIDKLASIWGELGGADCAWLNPPYRGVTPWMAKCADESNKGMKIITLTLSSIGSQWYKTHVKPNALSLILEDRITFEGQVFPFPKELMISLWGFGMTGLAWWSWRK